MPITQPDILLIILDTQRRDRLSIYGHDRETSPEFDTFAAEATLFERAVSPAQWTIPSHASMFTGLYPSTHRVTQSNSRVPEALPLLAEILQGGGYHTVGFCNNPLVGVLDNNLKRGFDHFYNYAGAAPNRPVDRRKSRIRREWSTRFRQFAWFVQNSFAHSDAMFRLSLNPLFVPLWTRFANYKGHTTHSITDFIDYMRVRRAGSNGFSNGADQPLFAFLNLMGTHLPYRPPQSAIDRVAPELKGDKHAYRFMRRFNADAARWASPPDPPLEDWERRAIDDFYDAEIVHQDEHLGRLLRYLDESGALDNTLVIIAADHGEGHGDHQFFGHGFVVYQELIHVPLVIRYPDRFPAGARVKTNVSTRRIFHTILDIAGLQPSFDEDHPNTNVEGLSLARATNCKPDTEGGLVFAEAFPPLTFLNVLEHRNPSLIDRLYLTQVRRGVYEDTHKLAVVANQIEGLFDVSADPGETADVAAEKPELAAELQRKIDDFVIAAERYRNNGDAQNGVDPSVEDNLRALGYID